MKLNLTDLRQNAHLNIAAASDKLGVPPETLMNWEKGITKLDLKDAYNIERVYKISKIHISW